MSKPSSHDEKRHFGKYRGTVTSTADPLLKGRIVALVSVGGTPLTVVAEACTPYLGFYAIPPEGSGVWIEFEEGDLDKPIWTGCWWREGEVLALLTPDLPPPDPVSAPKTVVLSVAPVAPTAAAVHSTARLKLNTVTGEVTLESLMPPASPALPIAIKLSALGVEVSYGPTTIHLTVTGVDVNKGALTILP